MTAPFYAFFTAFQVTASGQTRVVLDDVQMKLSGTYMCEVTVTPDYFALMEYANMTVIGESSCRKNSSSECKPTKLTCDLCQITAIRDGLSLPCTGKCEQPG